MTWEDKNQIGLREKRIQQKASLNKRVSYTKMHLQVTTKSNPYTKLDPNDWFS